MARKFHRAGVVRTDVREIDVSLDVVEFQGGQVKFRVLPLPRMGEYVRLVLGGGTKRIDVVVTEVGEFGYVTARRVPCVPSAGTTRSPAGPVSGSDD